MKKENELTKLADRYFSAETSLDEESELKKRLTGEDELPEDYETLRTLFAFFEAKKMNTAVPEFRNPAETRREKRKSRIVPISWISAAATVLFFVLAYQFIGRSTSEYPDDTFSDPEIAAENAVEALRLLSSELNKGSTITQQQMKELDNINIHLINFQPN